MLLKTGRFSLFVLFFLFLNTLLPLMAQGISPHMTDLAYGEEGMTLWQVIYSGGEIMLFLAMISVFAVGLVGYYYLTIRADKMIPEDFSNKVMSFVDKGQLDDARDLCKKEQNTLSKVYLAGFNQIQKDSHIVREHIEDQARQQVESVWQKISYLSDVAAISPMIGLLGTVLGMIQAFNVIAFQTGAVKPILLAGGISKAMVTTAAGLAIAIPAVMFHSFFRSRAHNIERHLEDKTTEFWYLLNEKKQDIVR